MARALVLVGGVFVVSFFVTVAYLGYTHLTAVAYEGVFKSTHTAELLFTGDSMFDRTVRPVLEKNPETIFGAIAPLLAHADFVVGNLEGPITTNVSQSLGTSSGEEGNTRFTFDPKTASVLAHYGFKLVSIANNHITDFGNEGVVATKQYLTNVRVAYVGDPFATSTEPMMESINGINVAFVAYNEFASPNAGAARAAIGRARTLDADFIIVLAHWGIEYQAAAPEYVRQLAETFAAAGADLIIGTHSHVIGEVDHIGSARVYYSLGNFIFDQYFDPSVRCGLTVSLVLTKIGTTTVARYSTQNVHLEHSRATTLGCPPFQSPDTLN